MKKSLVFLMLSVLVAVSVLSGCAQGTTTTTSTDTVAAASIVDNAAAFEKAIAKDGKWIICLTKDISVDKALVLDGDLLNGKKDDAGKDVYQRKIALYTQDADRKITARFTLTAKSLTINSKNASIQHGTFKGDLYVNVVDFELVDATIEGNVYFKSEEIKKSFKMDGTSKVTGSQEVKAG